MNWFHELGEWWRLLFDDREFTLLNCSDRFGKCCNWFIYRRCNYFWFLSDDSRLLFLSLNCHQFLSYIRFELIHIEFRFLNSGNWSLNKSWRDWLHRNLLIGETYKWFDGWRRRHHHWFRCSRSWNNNGNIGSLLLINRRIFGLISKCFFLYLIDYRVSIWAQRRDCGLYWLSLYVIGLRLDFCFCGWGRRCLIGRWWFIGLSRRILLSYFLHFLGWCLISFNWCSLLLWNFLALGI